VLYAALKRRSSTKPQRLKPSDFVGVFVARLEVVPFPFAPLSDKGQGQRTGVSAPQESHLSRRVRSRNGALSVMALPTQAKIGREWATADSIIADFRRIDEILSRPQTGPFFPNPLI
jgi:hypothetical protein